MSTYQPDRDRYASERVLCELAEEVLADNDTGQYVKPAEGLYPHQWLWDSCFIAIGLARVNAPRAAQELRGLLRGQWANGMMPHMIYSAEAPYERDANLWQTQALSPAGVRTSGITQPPMLAIAVEAVAAQLEPELRQVFLDQMVPALVRYHAWLYRDRDPEDLGLVALLHSWESGMDDTPAWTEVMQAAPEAEPAWDYQTEIDRTSEEQRASVEVARNMMGQVNVLTAHDYDSPTLLRESPVVVRDVAFNAILAAAGQALERVAAQIGGELPPKLQGQAAKTAAALERLWHEDMQAYCAWDVRAGALVPIPTVATYLPLMVAGLAPKRVQLLVDQAMDPHQPRAGIPSVSTSSPWYEPQRYWRGPVWINMNWMVVRGLELQGYLSEANELRRTILRTVNQAGFAEYYEPQQGYGLGADNFSWTAALVLDLAADMR